MRMGVQVPNPNPSPNPCRSSNPNPSPAPRPSPNPCPSPSPSPNPNPNHGRVQVPPSARMVVLQEDKFKSFFNKLSFALKQHEVLTLTLTLALTLTLTLTHTLALAQAGRRQGPLRRELLPARRADPRLQPQHRTLQLDGRRLPLLDAGGLHPYVP